MRTNFTSEIKSAERTKGAHKLFFLFLFCCVTLFNSVAQRHHDNGKSVKNVYSFNKGAAVSSKAAATCDTLYPPALYLSCGSSPKLYSDGSTVGYITGNNSFGDLEKAQKYYNSNNITISGVLVNAVRISGTASTIVKIYSIDPATKGPNTLLGTSSSVGTINASGLTYYSFSTPINISSDYAVSFVLPVGSIDTAAVVSSADGCSSGDSLSWEKWKNLSWHSLKVGWSIDIDLMIFPITCPSSTTPTADFSGTPTTVNKGSAVAFTDLSTGTPTSWTWTFPGGTPASSNAQNPSITYNTAGTYNVTLKATNGGGSNSVTKNAYITVVGPAAPVANFSGTPTTVNKGSAVSFTDLSTGTPTSWTWTFSSGTPATSNAQNPSITYNTVGTFNVTLKATNGTGSNSTTKTGYITVVQPPVPVVDFSANKTALLQGGNVTFTDLSTGTPTSWTWTFTGGTPTTSNNQNPTIAYNTAGVYNVTLTAANGGGPATTTKTGYITVTAPFKCTPKADPQVFASNMAFYKLGDVQSDNSLNTYYSVLPATLNYNASNPNNYVEAGRLIRFKVECTNKRSDGQSIVSGQCTISTSDTRIKITDASAGLNNVGWNNSGWTTDEFEIQADTSIKPGTIVKFNLDVKDGSDNFTTECIPILFSPLVYGTTSIDDDSNPDSNGNNNKICEPGETIEFYPFLDNASDYQASYVRGYFTNSYNLSKINIWDNKTGASGLVYASGWWNYSFGAPQSITAGQKNTKPEYDFVFDYNYTSTYQFKLDYIIAGGVRLMDSISSSASRVLLKWHLPFTFNAGSPLAPELIGIAPVKSADEQVSVFPSPTHEQLTVTIKNGSLSDNARLEVYDLVGKKVEVREVQLSASAYTIEVGTIPSGLYFVKVQLKDRTIIKRFIKD